MIDYKIDYLVNHLEFKHELTKWIQSFWGEYYPERTLNDWEKSLYCYKGQVPFTLVAFADVNGSSVPIGMASIRKNGMEGADPDSDWLAAVFVPPSYRSQGIASALIKRCIEVAKDLGIQELWLFTRTDGRLYKKLGWRLANEVEHQGASTKIMRNKL